jgi:hypothetical protein
MITARWNLLICTVFDLDDHCGWRWYIGRPPYFLELVD